MIDGISFATHRGASAAMARACTPFPVACASDSERDRPPHESQAVHCMGVQGVSQMHGDGDADLLVLVTRRRNRERGRSFSVPGPSGVQSGRHLAIVSIANSVRQRSPAPTNRGKPHPAESSQMLWWGNEVPSKRSMRQTLSVSTRAMSRTGGYIPAT